MDDGSTLEISNSKLSIESSNVKSSRTQLNGVTVSLTDFESHSDFQRNSRITFEGGDYLQRNGFTQIRHDALLQFSGGKGIHIEAGDLLLEGDCHVDGKLHNEAKLRGTDSVRNGNIFSLLVESFIQTSTGEWQIRRKRIGDDFTNSFISAVSAELSGKITLLNDEGLQVGERILILKADQLQVDPDLQVDSRFVEDPPMKWEVEGSQLFLVTMERTDTISFGNSLLPSAFFSLLLLFSVQMSY